MVQCENYGLASGSADSRSNGMVIAADGKLRKDFETRQIRVFMEVRLKQTAGRSMTMH
jgi:hypothetical protein